MFNFLVATVHLSLNILTQSVFSQPFLSMALGLVSRKQPWCLPSNLKEARQTNGSHRNRICIGCWESLFLPKAPRFAILWPRHKFSLYPRLALTSQKSFCFYLSSFRIRDYHIRLSQKRFLSKSNVAVNCDSPNLWHGLGKGYCLGSPLAGEKKQGSDNQGDKTRLWAFACFCSKLSPVGVSIDFRWLLGTWGQISRPLGLTVFPKQGWALRIWCKDFTQPSGMCQMWRLSRQMHCPLLCPGTPFPALNPSTACCQNCPLTYISALYLCPQ